MEPRRIHTLDPSIIRRIAAGEVVLSASGVTKELLENSIDAASTSIQVSTKNGGAKLLQIKDNGTGIHPDDLDLLCERHATSKIETYSDLEGIQSFGFRGEALASVAQVSRLKVVTMREGDVHAYEANYRLGKMVEQRPNKVAGIKGTLITVEDLFYNMPIRRDALRSEHEEYRAIMDVVGKYAVKYTHIGFTCKKLTTSTTGGAAGSSKSSLNKPSISAGLVPDINVAAGRSVLDTIKSVYGSAVVKQILPLEVKIPKHKIAVNGYVSNASYMAKKSVFIIFINGRLVDCSAIKKTMLGFYSRHLARNLYPFVYLDINLRPTDVDVNIHPTKSDVGFLYSEELAEALLETMNEVIRGAELTRTFVRSQAALVQQPVVLEVVPKKRRAEDECLTSCQKQDTANPKQTMEDENDNDDNDFNLALPEIAAKALTTSFRTQKVHPSKMVRIDPADQTMDAFVVKTRHPKPELERKNHSDSQLENNAVAIDPEDGVTPGIDDSRHPAAPKWSDLGDVRKARLRTASAPDLLDSIKNLIAERRQDCHTGLKELCKQLTYVGMFFELHRLFVLAQSGTRLLMLDMYEIVKELTYQQTLHRFADMQYVALEPPLRVDEILCVHSNLHGNQELIDKATQLLIEKSGILGEYYSIQIEQLESSQAAVLSRLPVPLPNQPLEAMGLPDLLYDLAFNTDYSTEQECFRDISSHLGTFFAKILLAFESKMKTEDNQEVLEPFVQCVVLPMVKTEFYIPNEFSSRRGVFTELASLERLYRVFERC